MNNTGQIVVALERVKGLFVGVPDARLSIVEASRISGLDDHLCRQLLAALVDVRFLSRERDGTYRRCGRLFADESTPNARLAR